MTSYIYKSRKKGMIVFLGTEAVLQIKVSVVLVLKLTMTTLDEINSGLQIQKNYHVIVNSFMCVKEQKLYSI